MRKRFVTLIAAASIALGTVGLVAPAEAHSSDYCGHSSTTSGLNIVRFSSTVANNPAHEHGYNHYLYVMWPIYQHWTSRAC